MNIEDIQKFLDKKTDAKNEYVKITFRKRPAIQGLFVRENRDYAELKSKNFWRIVPESQFASYQQTKDIGLAKIFSGSDFSRLTLFTGNVE
ncbi:MAG: short-chain dehydrogenase [Flavisolibacter sp.]